MTIWIGIGFRDIDDGFSIIRISCSCAWWRVVAGIGWGDARGDKKEVGRAGGRSG